MTRWTAGLVALGVMIVPARAGAVELIGVCGVELCAASEQGTVTPITSDGASGAYSRPSVSADGSVLIYLRDGAPHKGGYRGQGATKLLDTTKGRASALSADGASFAFRTFDSYVGPGGFRLVSNLRIGGAAGSALWSNESRVNTAGWLGGQLIVTQQEGSAPDLACLVAVIPEGPPPCGRKVAVDPTRQITEPRGAPDQQTVVAAAELRSNDQTLQETDIALYDAATGALVRDLTTGPADTSPSFSPDGTRVAFTRGNDTWVVPTAGGVPRLLAAGIAQASWGGPADPAPGPSPAPAPGPAPTPGAAAGRVSLTSARLGLTGRRLRLTLRCTAAAGCARATLTLRQGKRSRAVVRVPGLRRGARRTLTVMVSSALARQVRRSGSRGLRLTLTGAGRAPRAIRMVARR